MSNSGAAAREQGPLSPGYTESALVSVEPWFAPCPGGMAGLVAITTIIELPNSGGMFPAGGGSWALTQSAGVARASSGAGWGGAPARRDAATGPGHPQGRRGCLRCSSPRLRRPGVHLYMTECDNINYEMAYHARKSGPKRRVRIPLPFRCRPHEIPLPATRQNHIQGFDIE